MKSIKEIIITAPFFDPYGTVLLINQINSLFLKPLGIPEPFSLSLGS
jgi:hypothetical protein